MVNVSAPGSQSPSAGVFPWTLTTRARYFYGHGKDVEEHEGFLLQKFSTREDADVVRPPTLSSGASLARPRRRPSRQTRTPPRDPTAAPRSAPAYVSAG